MTAWISAQHEMVNTLEVGAPIQMQVCLHPLKRPISSVRIAMSQRWSFYSLWLTLGTIFEKQLLVSYWWLSIKDTRGHLNIKTRLSRYRDSCDKDEMVSQTVLSLLWESVRQHLFIETSPRAHLNIKMPYYPYGNCPHKDKTIVRVSHLHNGNTYIWKGLNIEMMPWLQCKLHLFCIKPLTWTILSLVAVHDILSQDSKAW